MLDKIHELNRRRCEAAETVKILGYMNSPIDYEERLKADARYRLAKDAMDRTEKEYADALAKLTTDELVSLSYRSITSDEESALK